MTYFDYPFQAYTHDCSNIICQYNSMLPFSIAPGEHEIGFLPFQIVEGQMFRITFNKNLGPDVNWTISRVEDLNKYSVIYQGVQKNNLLEPNQQQQFTYDFISPSVYQGRYRLKLICVGSNQCRLGGVVEILPDPSWRYKRIKIDPNLVWPLKKLAWRS